MRVLLVVTLLTAVDGFSIAPTTRGLSSCALSSRRVTVPQLSEDVDAAAAAVKKAAAKFGKAQADSTATWLDAVVKDGNQAETLLQEQLALFEECLVDDEGDKCKELDAALTTFEAALTEGATEGETKAKANLRKFAQGRAGARVRAAAGKFGPTQKAFAVDWTNEAISAGATSSSLMEQTLKLFDQCEVTEDGKADPKCVALFEALDNLQVALTGEVATPSAEAVGGDADHVRA